MQLEPLLRREAWLTSPAHFWLPVVLRLEPGETKNREGRMFPLTRELRAVLERQRERTTAVEEAKGRIIPWVFSRGGQRIKTFRRSWLTACRKAGVPGKIPHDLRRSAGRRF